MHKEGQGSVSRALYEELRDRIGDGTLAPGAALPSTRGMAAERGLSRTTVSLVYEQLAADGFIETRPGAASRVARSLRQGPSPGPERATMPGPAAPDDAPVRRISRSGARLAALQLPAAAASHPAEIDFVYGPLARQDFPAAAWLKAQRAVAQRGPARLAYGDPMGDPALRQALQAHLGRSRGMACAVEQLMIVNGSQQALDLCARVLLDPGDVVVVEQPGYRMAYHVFENAGAVLAPVAVDAQGLQTDHLAQVAQAQALYVTPTHQFPLGGFLPMGRRLALLAWAQARGAWVIEDDYDGEYRHGVRPEPSLRTLDAHDGVIHIGTFSKTLSPELRLGYLLLPRALVRPFAMAKRLADRHTATAPQRALAQLLADGSYDRHLRRMRRQQRARQQALLLALAHTLGTQVQVQGAASGLHVVVWFPELPVTQEMALVEAAADQRVRVYPVGRFDVPGHTAAGRPAGLVMGYALLEAAQIEEGVHRLAVAYRRLRQAAARSRPDGHPQASPAMLAAGLHKA